MPTNVACQGEDEGVGAGVERADTEIDMHDTEIDMHPARKTKVD